MSFVGDRKAYRLDPRPLGEGGYATVYRATRKANEEVVAFKRLKSVVVPEYSGRLRREIKVQTELANHPNVMPVLDAAEAADWYVMPLSAGDMEALKTEWSERPQLVKALMHAAAGLQAGHECGYVHRDVTPRNILALDDHRRRRRVVSDWGLVRQPRGKTTMKWTKTGTQLGTEGFIAPEVLSDPHEKASPAADVYSLGRVLAWAETGKWPSGTAQLLPNGPFRALVRAATAEQPQARPTLDEFVQAVERADEPFAPDIPEQAAAFAEEAETDVTAAKSLWNLALDNPQNPAIFLDSLPKLRGDNLRSLLAASPSAAIELVEAMKAHLLDGDAWGDRHFDYANVPLRWLQNVAGHAVALADTGLLEDAAAALFLTDAHWNRFEQRRHTRAWLEQLRGDAAATAARALRRCPQAVDWYMAEDWQPRNTADALMRSVLHSRQ